MDNVSEIDQEFDDDFLINQELNKHISKNQPLESSFEETDLSFEQMLEFQIAAIKVPEIDTIPFHNSKESIESPIVYLKVPGDIAIAHVNVVLEEEQMTFNLLHPTPDVVLPLGIIITREPQSQLMRLITNSIWLETKTQLLALISKDSYLETDLEIYDFLCENFTDEETKDLYTQVESFFCLIKEHNDIVEKVNTCSIVNLQLQTSIDSSRGITVESRKYIQLIDSKILSLNDQVTDIQMFVTQKILSLKSWADLQCQTLVKISKKCTMIKQETQLFDDKLIELKYEIHAPTRINQGRLEVIAKLFLKEKEIIRSIESIDQKFSEQHQRSIHLHSIARYSRCATNIQRAFRQYMRKRIEKAALAIDLIEPQEHIEIANLIELSGNIKTDICLEVAIKVEEDASSEVSDQELIDEWLNSDIVNEYDVKLAEYLLDPFTQPDCTRSHISSNEDKGVNPGLVDGMKKKSTYKNHNRGASKIVEEEPIGVGEMFRVSMYSKAPLPPITILAKVEFDESDINGGQKFDKNISILHGSGRYATI